MTGERYPSTQGHLGQNELATLLIVVISSRVFLGLPHLMSIIGGNAAWLTLTIAFLTALGVYFLLDLLLERFPGRDLIDIARQTTGFFHYAISLILILFFLAVTALVTRIFAEIFVVGILPRTPIGVITGCLLILLIWAAYMGLETISRLAVLYSPYLLLFMSLILLLVLPNIDSIYLFPILGRGLGRTILPAMAKSSVFADIVLLAIYAPSLRERDRRRKLGIKVLAGSYLVMLAVTLIFGLVFPYPASAKLLLPVFQLARLISLAEFFQRTEAIFIFIWFFVAVISLATAFYTISYLLCRTFRLTTHRPLLFPLAVLVFALSLLPRSFAAAIQLDSDLLRYYGWIPGFATPLLILLLALLRGKKGVEGG